jgi:O-antigen biosynthesis protein
LRLLNKYLKKIRRAAQAGKARRSEQGLRALILERGLFDPQFYLEQYPDVAQWTTGDLDPLAHYIRYGGVEGRNPGADFDAKFYLQANADVRNAGLNPLVHYLQHGEAEGRLVRPVAVPARAPRPAAPAAAAWDDLADALGERPSGSPGVDIVVPVYRGLDETANCLHTVLRSRLAAATADGDIDCELVVIDDASPDPALSELLRSLADRGLFTLLRNERNLGFVASVNKGMALHPGRDVILLNSDTEVFNDWVERLHRAAYRDVNIGTVTPLSNNATICSYPNFAGEFHGRFEMSFEDLDGLAREANAGLAVDIPTAVGFCMYVRRQCLDEVGLFDLRFGLGYGEENDFSRRIAARGWRNVLAGDVFVRHLGRVSFLTASGDLGREALRIMKRRHPQYLEDIQTCLKTDPPRVLRRNLDLARLRRASARRSFLFVSHNLDGGTGRHVRDLTRRLSQHGIGVFTLQPKAGNATVGELSHASVEDLSVVNEIDMRHGLAAAARLLRDLGIVHMHVHHLMGFDHEAVLFMQVLARECGIEYDFTVHDYTPVCPRVTMMDATGAYCGNSDIEVCETCVRSNGSPFGDVGVWFWRASYGRLLEGARRIFVPDEDVETRLKPFLPDLPVTVRPHPETVPDAFLQPVARRPDGPLRVAIIGATGRHKGSLQILQCAEDALRRNLPIRFVLIGFADMPALRTLPNVETTGAYEESDLPAILARSQCHLAFFPSVCPETYSFTLSQAFFAGLYPVAFDIGAVARRIRAGGWGHVLPAEMMWLPARVNDALLGLDIVQPPVGWQPVPGGKLYSDILRDYYDLELDGTAQGLRGTRRFARQATVHGEPTRGVA